ncbi:MAG: M81 family metallopeptidase, partial [Rhodospirillales bacterium]|nr:M81 family metallopeptidase [Rhodospirillales bacterium]
AGFVAELRQADATVVPLLAAEAAEGPPLMRESFHVLAVELVHRLAARLPVDAVLLATDAALRVEDEADAAAELIERARLVLSARTPIVVALHGAATARLADTGAIIVSAQEHEDRAAFGRRVARRVISGI